MDIWGAFGQAPQPPETTAQLASLTARWLYDTRYAGHLEEDSRSPLTAHSELPGQDGRVGPSHGSTAPAAPLPHILLQITFDLAHDSHHSMLVQPLDGDGGTSGYAWTEMERARAKLAREPQTVDNLKEEVFSQN